MELKEFFSYIRRNRSRLARDKVQFCESLATRDPCLTAEIREFLDKASIDERNYAVSSAYALLIGDDRRKKLSAYFTPPALAQAALDAAVPFLRKIADPTILDPACGGGSFLTPVARYLISRKCKRGFSTRDACTAALKNVRGIEIDPGLADLSQFLLRAMLKSKWGFESKEASRVVRSADALGVPSLERYDLVIGNPPFGKVGDRISGSRLKQAGLANLGGHTNLYSLFLLRGLDWVKPGGGLVFVLPPSFVAGPYFAGLRQEMLHRAEIMRIDLHEQRDQLFLGAVQDICLLTLKKREALDKREVDLPHSYELGFIDANGVRSREGTGMARPGGEPWTLPVENRVSTLRPLKRDRAEEQKFFTLADYGYHVRVGKVVPTRERDRLHPARAKGDLPLVWASSIRPDGSFDFFAAKQLGNAMWYSPSNRGSVRYATRKPCVVVQRTSNRDQRRRLNAAAVPKSFRDRNARGFVAENHVIVVEALAGRPSLTPRVIAAILNSSVVNERFSAVSGSFSISAKLLQRMALPDPEHVRKLELKAFEHGLRQLCEGVNQILAPKSHAPRDTKDAIDEPRNLNGSQAVNQKTRLKGRAIA